ncbi:hypothetical protein NO1_1873, partial [Candidatus Termititenax aidoneus]
TSNRDISGVFSSKQEAYIMNNHGKPSANLVNCHPTIMLNAGHNYDETSAGSGQAFDVIPAFYTVIYIMKVA